MTTNDDPDNNGRDRVIAERRIKMYSSHALSKVSSIDKALVLYTQFNGALEALDFVASRVQAYENIPAGLRIIGDSGAGKTTILDYFMASHPVGGISQRARGILRINLRRRTNIYALMETLLIALEFPLPNTNWRNVTQRQGQALDWLTRKGIFMVIVDEAHRMLVGPPTAPRDGNDCSAFMCEIANLQIAVVLAGGPSLERLQEFDQFLYSRCATSIHLKKFDDGPKWRGIIHGIASKSEHSIEFLNNPQQCTHLHAAASGNLRALKLLVGEAVLVSVDAGEAGVTLESIRIACDRVKDDALGLNPWKAQK